MSLLHWLQLSLTDGIGPITIVRMVDAAGSAEAACQFNESDLRQIDGLGSDRSRKIAQSLRQSESEAEGELDRVQRSGFSLLCPDDQAYPALLRSIPDPPAVLYMSGSLEPRDLNAVAIVGSRKCSMYGREQAERFGALLAGAGVTVLSGGARGIDSAAHRGAISHSLGRTIAVLGSGVDVAYPPENESLFKQIAQRGAVLSEYPLGTPPTPENFPRRNRIVSGMSRGVLVIEADTRSGALITARQAADDHGRTVFALPGRVDNPVSAGTHQLIRDGATLVTGLQDVLEGLGPFPQEVHEPELFTDQSDPSAELSTGPPTGPPPTAVAAPVLATTELQARILEHLSKDPVAVDMLVERTSLAAHIVLQELTFMSLKGLVKRVDGQSYAKR